MAKSTSKQSSNTDDQVLTTAVGNSELYADTTSPRKLQALALSNKNKQEKEGAETKQ